MQISVGLSDMKISSKHEDLMATRELGSDIAIAVHDSVHHVGGVYRGLLPSSAVYPDMAAKKPQMFLDTGIPLFINQLLQQGAVKDNLTAQIAGGADLLETKSNFFSIGRQNGQAALAQLQTQGILGILLDIGGKNTRSLFLQIKDGKIWVERRGVSG